jgi:hypothetical protein
MTSELNEDIVKEITDDELCEIFSKRYEKIEHVIQQKNDLGLKVQLIYSKSLKSFKIVLLDNQNREKSYFSFDTNNNNHIGSGDPVFLSISVDEDLRDKKFSWLLVGTLIGMIMKREYINLFRTSARCGSIGLNSDTIIGIDADASHGFWDHIGLKPGRFTWDLPMSERRMLPTSQSPFEKSITLDELSRKILDKSFIGGRNK